MPKTLLHIELIKDGICSAEISCTDTLEKERTAASLLSLMDQNEEFARLVINSVSVFLLKRRHLAELNKKAMRSAEIKTKN